MKELNLNIERWSMLDSNETEPMDFDSIEQELVSLADDISNTNIDDVYDINNREYIN